ncbi:uncharacterized protein BKA78DRAFT_350455 [Phyllosticta capitalensis]|uniref:uncharacterized protein n=1 Tax=Phyllosticta capitalensis TaxID=121624 RepID=UPI00312CD188
MAAAPAPNGGAPASSVGSPISSAASPSGMSVAGSSSGPVSRRFAPLDPAKARLLVGQENVSAALSIPPQIDILEHIYSLPPPQQPHAMAAIRSIERRAMAVQQPQPGLVPLMDYLESRMLRKAICTRNFDAPVLHLLESFLPGHSFDPIVTRDFRPPKPHPAGILSIAKAWGCLEGPVAGAVPTPHMPPPLGEGQAVVPPPPLAPLTPPDLASAAGSPGGSSVAGIEGEAAVIAGSAPSLIMVGDSLDDMVAGRRAGAATVLLLNESNMHLARREETDLVIRRLDDLIVVLENGFVGQHGT